MNKPKAVKDWESLVAAQGCVVTGQSDVQLHHVYGRTYVNNKVHIGSWYILPLCWRLHDVHSNDPLNVTHWPKRFAAKLGRQKDLFMELCAKIQDQGHELPFGDDVIEAIKATTR